MIDVPQKTRLTLNLEHAACTPGGPVLLMLGTRRIKTLLPALGYEEGLAYDDTGLDTKPGELRSALPPPQADSEYMVWVSGPQGSQLAPAMAGIIAGRSREVAEKLDAFQRRNRGRQ